jgi:PII-like signaling protein
MKGFQLEFFMDQNTRHGHQAQFDWLLETARSHGIGGCTVFMGAMGYGRHRRIHSAHFFELGDQPVEVTMVVTEQEAEKLLTLLEQENVRMFFVKMPVEFGAFGSANGK